MSRIRTPSQSSLLMSRAWCVAMAHNTCQKLKLCVMWHGVVRHHTCKELAPLSRSGMNTKTTSLLQVCTTVAQCGELFLQLPGISAVPLLMRTLHDDAGTSDTLVVETETESHAWQVRFLPVQHISVA